MRFYFFIIIFLFGPLFSLAQEEKTIELKDKKIGVYFSKKEFTYDENFEIPLQQFILKEFGDTTKVEDLKLQALIAIGFLYSSQLQDAIHADTTFFLNAEPELARAFISKYHADERKMDAAPDEFKGLDYILVVNPLIFGSYKTSSVYSRSNRIVTEHIIIKTARLRIDCYEPSSGLLMGIFETCFDDRQTKIPEILFDFHNSESQTGKFIAKMFTLTANQINSQQMRSCE